MANTTTTKRITIATLKSFIKKNEGKLIVNIKSRFDGMTDGVESLNGGFTPAVATTEHMEHSLGIKGAWFVGQSRDYFTAFENETLKGFEVSNSCGRFIIAIDKTATPEPKPVVAPVEVKLNDQVLFARGTALVVGNIVEVREKAVKMDYAIEPPVLSAAPTVYNYSCWVPKSVFTNDGRSAVSHSVKKWFANKFEGGHHIKRYMLGKNWEKIFV